MKIVEKEIKIIKKIEVDYENNIKCEYITVNDKIDKYTFYNENNKTLTYVDDIEVLKNSSWDKHHKLIKKKKFNTNQIKNFKDFDKLYYVGGFTDGILTDRHGNHISTVIQLDENFSLCSLNIETKKKKCKKIIKSLKSEYIVDSKVSKIPLYNWDEYKKHHYTISLNVKLPDDIYSNFLKDEDYLNDTIKKDIFNFLKTDDFCKINLY